MADSKWAYGVADRGGMTPLSPLTSLRFFAAAGVLLLHSSCFAGDSETAHAFLSPAIAGVTFFFILSGFILGYVYPSSFAPLERSRVRQFLVARVARIFPLHWLTFLFCLGVTWEGIRILQGTFGSSTWRAAANLCLFQGYGPDHSWRIGFNSPAWSLSVEWTCYLCFPFLAAGLAARRWSIRIGVCVLASTGFLWGWYCLATAGFDSAEAGLLTAFPPTRFFEFFCGCLLALAFRAWKRRQPTAASVSPVWQWTLAETGVVAAVGGSLAFAGRHELPVQIAMTWNGYYIPAFALTLWVFAVGRGRLSQLLSGRVLVRLGEASFALYMVHFGMILWAARLLGWSLARQPWFWPTFVLANVGVSLAIHRWFEIPCRDWLRRRWSEPAHSRQTDAPGPSRRAA